MPHTLKYEVRNASVALTAQATEVNGEPATLHIQRALIDLVPVGHAGGTLAIAIPAAAIGDFPEGASVTVTIATDAPAETETPEDKEA